MGKTINSLATYAFISLLVGLDAFYGVEHAGNLGVFLSWFFILIGALALFSKPDDLFSEGSFHLITKPAQYAMILFMAFSGWMVTASFYMFVAVSMHIKRLVWLKEKSTENLSGS